MTIFYHNETALGGKKPHQQQHANDRWINNEVLSLAARMTFHCWRWLVLPTATLFTRFFICHFTYVHIHGHAFSPCADPYAAIIKLAKWIYCKQRLLHSNTLLFFKKSARYALGKKSVTWLITYLPSTCRWEDTIKWNNRVPTVRWRCKMKIRKRAFEWISYGQQVNSSW